MLDIELIVKGGDELAEFYPEKYGAFEKKLSALVMDTFPGAGTCSVESQPGWQAEAREKRRKEKEEEELKQALIELFQEPEIQAMIQNRAGKVAPSSA